MRWTNAHPNIGPGSSVPAARFHVLLPKFLSVSITFVQLQPTPRLQWGALLKLKTWFLSAGSHLVSCSAWSKTQGEGPSWVHQSAQHVTATHSQGLSREAFTLCDSGVGWSQQDSDRDPSDRLPVTGYWVHVPFFPPRPAGWQVLFFSWKWQEGMAASRHRWHPLKPRAWPAHCHLRPTMHWGNHVGWRAGGTFLLP